MAYSSPKTLRRQQRNADAKTFRPARKNSITVMADSEWDRKCDFAIACLHTQANEGHCDAAGRHAQALVHMAVQRRAAEIQRDYHRAYWKAMQMARHELLNGEVA